MKYYISDLHLFHENAIAFDPRPFASLQEMHDTILKNWNDRVTNGDMVYILGENSTSVTPSIIKGRFSKKSFPRNSSSLKSVFVLAVGFAFL